MTQVTTKVTLLASLLVLIATSTIGVFFEDGYDHHYTYSSETDVLGMHNITTIIKVLIKEINVIYMYKEPVLHGYMFNMVTGQQSSIESK